MKNITKNFTIEDNLDWTYGIQISKLRAELDRLEALGANEIDIEATESYGSAYVEITAYCNRLETDEECKERISEEKARKDNIERREMETLKRLQDKYNR